MARLTVQALARVLVATASLCLFATAHTAGAANQKSRLKGGNTFAFTIPDQYQVGIQHSYTFNFFDANNPSAPCPPMSVNSISPSPPAPGLQLTTSSPIQLTGTPTTAGTFTFNFTANASDPQGLCGTPTAYTVSVRVQPEPPAAAAPDLTTPQAIAAVTAPSQQLRNIQQRLDNLRTARNPTVTQGLKVSYGGQDLPPLSALALAAKDKDGVQTPQRGGGAAADTPHRGGGAAADGFSRWGAFLQGALDVGKLDTTSAQNGFDLHTDGLTLGADYRLPGNHVLGAALGYVKADTDLANNAGNQDVKGWSVSLFGEYVPAENAYIDLAMTYGQNEYDGVRRDTQSVPQAEYNSSPRGNQFGIALSAGYQFYYQSWTFNPYGRVEYINASIDAFEESGGPTKLAVGEQRYTNTVLSLGGQVQYAWSQTWGVLVPYARAEYQYLAQNSANDFSAGYVGIVGTQPVPIPGADKSSGAIAVGATAVTARGFSGYFNYQYLFGKENFTQSSYTLGIRYEF